MTDLVRYDAACRAIADAKAVDEVKDIRDKAVAMAAYARQAKNHELEADAVEIRMRATRRLDQMRQAQKETMGLNEGGRPKTGFPDNPVSKPTLASQGIDKNLAHQARMLGAMSDEKFEVKIAEARDAVNRAVRTVVTQDDKAERRAERERDLGAAQRALPSKKYGVIYADPPWHFQPYSNATGMDRAADNHYPTMDLAAIMALPVPAADNAVLFLWATVPMLSEALAVMASWGFAYKSNFVWVKNKIGTGYWVRNRHEFLLIGVKGSVPAPAPGKQYDSVIEELAGAHSAKPFLVHEIIEDMFPTLPRIELFARVQFEGWDAWGNEVALAS